jgi:hypothetical protein
MNRIMVRKHATPLRADFLQPQMACQDRPREIFVTANRICENLH